MRYEQLPAALRSQVDAKVGRAQRAPRARTPRRGRPPGGQRWRCPQCPDREPFTAYATVERHVRDEHGHGRIEAAVTPAG